MLQKIIPNLWFDHNAEEAVKFYLSIFPNSKIITTNYYPTEGLADFQKDFAGKVLTIEYTIDEYHFVAINAGSEFSPNPSVSFMLNFDPTNNSHAEENLNRLWNKLIAGGEALMPLQEYPFSKRYGWVKDKYGFTWQLILTDPKGKPRPFITPSLMFCGKNNGLAEEAIRFYSSIFSESKIGNLAHYIEDTGPAPAGSLMYGDFMLWGQWFVAMDSGVEHDFNFNEALSLAITCKDQEEIDYFWEKLTENGGEESMCGWLKDRYGLSWQVAPEGIDKLVSSPKAFANMMQMKKIIIKDLEK